MTEEQARRLAMARYNEVAEADDQQTWEDWATTELYAVAQMLTPEERATVTFEGEEDAEQWADDCADLAEAGDDGTVG